MGFEFKFHQVVALEHVPSLISRERHFQTSYYLDSGSRKNLKELTTNALSLSLSKDALALTAARVSRKTGRDGGLMKTTKGFNSPDRSAFNDCETNGKQVKSIHIFVKNNAVKRKL